MSCPLRKRFCVAGCGKIAIFNTEEGEIPLFCNDHKSDEMINVILTIRCTCNDNVKLVPITKGILIKRVASEDGQKNTRDYTLEELSDVPARKFDGKNSVPKFESGQYISKLRFAPYGMPGDYSKKNVDKVYVNNGGYNLA